MIINSLKITSYSATIYSLFFCTTWASISVGNWTAIVSEIFTWLGYIILTLFFLAAVFSVMDTYANNARRINNKTIVPKIKKPIQEGDLVIVQPMQERLQRPHPVYKKPEPVTVAPEPKPMAPSLYL